MDAVVKVVALREEEHDLLQWCLAHDVVVADIAAAVAAGWRGVVATAHIQAGSCILRVPRALLMSNESARRDERLQQHLLGTNLTPVQGLILHLLDEAAKGPASFWHVYLKTLPAAYTTGMCFPPAAIAALQVGHAQQEAQHAFDATMKDWAQAVPLLRRLLGPKWRSKAAWRWAASTLSSRTMFMPGDAAGALTPFGDLHNYQPPPPPLTPRPRRRAGESDESAAAAEAAEAEAAVCGDGHLDEEAGEYRIYARRRYSPGEQVFLCYGRHTNLELLVHYGFVMAHNPHDTAILPSHLLPPPVLERLRAAGEAPAVHADGSPSWELLRALRLAGASPPERRAKAYLALQDERISAASELWAVRTLRRACAAAAAALPTTLEEDEALLAGTALSACERVAVEWRAIHKRTLLKGAEWT